MKQKVKILVYFLKQNFKGLIIMLKIKRSNYRVKRYLKYF